MSGKMHFQTVDIIAPENYSSVLKGTVNASSNINRLQKSFPASPILSQEYDPKQTFIDLVLAPDVSDPDGDPTHGLGHWGISADYKRDYFIDGVSSEFSAPNLLKVKPFALGGPASPFTPNAASPDGDISLGTGQINIVDPAAEKTSRAPFVGNDADSSAAQPSTTSELHRKTTLEMFDQELPTGIMGSNTTPPPKGV